MHPALTETIIVAAPQAVCCEVAGETVILEMASGQYFALDPIGTAVWKMVRQRCSLDEICGHLMAEYEVSREQCQTDVAALIEQMAQHGLVRLESRAER